MHARVAAFLCVAITLLPCRIGSAQMGGMGMGGMGGMGGGMGGMGGGMGGMGGGMGGMGGGMGGMGGMGGGMGGMGMGGMGGGASQGAGVVVDAQGVLRMQTVADAGLDAARCNAALEAVPGDLRQPVALRKVALARLEAEYARAVAAGESVPDEILKLAGLTRVQYVFVYPAADGRPGDVVLAGPAEPWITDALGRTMGLASGSPTLLLEDLVAAIRAFAPGQRQERLIGCSIDPTQEGLAAMRQYVQKLGRVNPQGGADRIVAGMKESLGAQRVSVQGVSPATHFAKVMVEADYRMKLIGIGLEPPPVRMATWIDLAGAASVAANALQRWYFVPDYQCVRVSTDDLAIELVGRGVKLCNADEVVLPDGRRLGAGRADKASKTFTETFTRKYCDIAARSPVYAQLRNVIDMAILAAWMQEHDAYGKAAWQVATLGDEKSCPIETQPVASEAETAIHAVWRGNRLLTPIGGGVTLVPRQAIDEHNLLPDDKGTVAAARAATATLPAEGWYWD